MVRKDNWTNSEDEYLATTVLNCIIVDETQLKAFREVGLKINRTSAACGFRWNSTLRHKYKNEIIKAKTIKLINKMKTKSFNHEEISFDAVISYLLKLKSDHERLEKHKEILQQKIRSVSSEIQQRRSEMEPDVRENTESLAKILSKAVDLGIFEHNKKPAI